MQTNGYRFANIDPCETCNGIGFGVTLFTQGCSHHCPGCHNMGTWDPNGGKMFKENNMRYLYDRCSNPNIRRLTISGGEPFESPELVMPIAFWFAHTFPEKQLWIYSGYTYEELVSNAQTYAILMECDVLVDGPFILSERDITLPFRGSRNQRIIDVPASLIAGHIVELEVA